MIETLEKEIADLKEEAQDLKEKVSELMADLRTEKINSKDLKEQLSYYEGQEAAPEFTAMVDKEKYDLFLENYTRFTLEQFEEFLKYPTRCDWAELGKIAAPEKWIQMYKHYQELLTKEDVAPWWQEQFEIANKERNELKSKMQ